LKQNAGHPPPLLTVVDWAIDIAKGKNKQT